MEKEFIRERTDNSLNPRKAGEPSPGNSAEGQSVKDAVLEVIITSH